MPILRPGSNGLTVCADGVTRPAEEAQKWAAKQGSGGEAMSDRCEKHPNWLKADCAHCTPPLTDYQRGRREALEEAAKVADETAQRYWDAFHDTKHDDFVAMNTAAQTVAFNIRALKDKPHG
jgi:hypothetical protein